MIRVLQVLATLKRAGAETMVASLVCGLDRTRFEPHVISMYDSFPSGLEPTLDAAGIKVMHLSKRKGFDWKMFGAIHAAISQFRPHIVHTHSYVMRYVLPDAVSRRDAAFVHTVHNVARREVDALGRAIHRIAYRAGAVPVAVSGEVALSFRELYGFDPAVIPNGVPTASFYRPECRDRWRRQNGFRHDEVLFLSMARLEPQKNPLLLADAFKGVPFGQLLFAGEGSLRDGLQGKDRVRLLGVRQDTVDLLNACDVFVMASDWEGHPLALIEAMAAGLPVVATSVGGVPGIVGDNGVLVPAGDVHSLRDALVMLGSDAQLRKQLGAAARLRAQSFDVSTMIAGYQALFERIVVR